MIKSSNKMLLDEDDSFNYKSLFLRMLDYWYWFFISFIISIIAGYLFIKYVPAVYEVSTTLMVENTTPSFSTERILEEMNLFSPQKNILNEKVIIQSYSTIKATLKKLDYTVEYRGYNGYSYTELYNENCPFLVIRDSLVDQLINADFYINILSDNKFSLQCNVEEASLFSYKEEKGKQKIENFSFNKTFHFNETIKSNYFKFKIIKNPNFNSEIDDFSHYVFHFSDLNSLTLKYREALKVNLLEKGIDVLIISLQSENIPKAADFLNELTKVYINYKLAKKNIIATNTIEFIDNQLISITDSLLLAENTLQNYRSNSKIIDMSFQTQKLFDMITKYEQDKAVLITQQKYYEYLKQTLEKNDELNNLIIPSTVGVQDENLNKMVIELTELSSKRLNLLYQAQTKSSIILSLENKIKNMKQLLLNNVESIIEASNISMQNINDQIKRLNEESKKLPKAQQKLFGFERKYNLSNEIYNFLMQKRAEAQIAKASNTADSEVIDKARYDVFEKKSVKYRQIFLISILLGLILPFLGIFFLETVQDHIVIRKDIEKITTVPIVSGIIQDKKQITKVFLKYPKSAVAESFRSFYANLQYFTKGQKNSVILISSSMPKEGKTFTSINLASVFASFGKRTCLLSFDLRLPKVHNAFNIENNKGLSTFLINETPAESIIHKTEFENLFIIPSGPVPPNPVELIASENTMQLFNYLKANFDTVIIDTPPIGVVADGLLLAQYSDINIHIVRQNYTKKKALKIVIRELQDNNIKNVSILFNGIKQSKLYGYDYGYGYGYDKGYEYFKEKKEKWWKKFKS